MRIFWHQMSRRAATAGGSLLLVLSTLGTSLEMVAQSTPARADSYQTSNDNGSTGWYPNQPLLTPSSVQSGSFKKIFDATLSGKIYAQPLVSQGTVLAVTENDMAYGVDSSSGNPRWPAISYGPVASPAVDPANDSVCGDIGANLGITGTPVIDPATHIAYFVAARATGPLRVVGGVTTTTHTTQYWMEAVYVATGQAPANWPAGGVLISGSADNHSGTWFNSDYQTQRPGLVLVNGVVYAAFSAQCDIAPSQGTYAGWLIGVSVSSATPKVTTMWASVTGGNDGGGIWQSGGAPVVDSSGNIFVATGNVFSSSLYPAPPADGFGSLNNYGESVVKLSTSSGTLTPVNWFTPANATYLDRYDLDLSSGGPVELPSSMGTPQQPHVLMAVGKDATLFSLDMSNLGGYQNGTAGTDAVPSELRLSGGVWGRPAVWPGDGGYIYLPTTGSVDKETTGTFNAYQRTVSSSGAVGFQLAGTAGVGAFGYTSGSPVVTSNSTNSGSALVWIIHSNDATGSGGQLEAFDPLPQNPGSSGTLTRVWSSGTFSAEKYSVPGVGNDALFVGTQDGHLLGFGSGTSAMTGNDVTFPSTVISQSSTMDATFTATADTTVESFATSAPFTLGPSSPALPAALTAGQTISVPVTFTPSRIGTTTGTLTANTSTSSVPGTTTVTVSGSGIGATSTVVASPTSVNFGLRPIGSTPVSQSVTMTNASGAPITIDSFTPPPTTTPFAITGAPASGSSLANGASISYTVTFNPPGSSGNFTHSFSSVATLNTSVGKFGVPVAGAAAPLALLALIPTSLAFPAVPVGQSSTLNFNVVDNGGLPLTITSSTPPASASGFQATTSLAPGTVIAASSSREETVTFTPTTAGTLHSSWTFASNDGNPPAILDISGTGTMVTPGSPTNVAASAGRTSASVDWLAPGFDGGGTIETYTVKAADATDPARGGETCVAPGPATTCVVVGLTKGDSYVFNVTASNAAGSGPPSSASSLVRVGLAAHLALSSARVRFGDLALGSSAVRTFSLLNSGDFPVTLTRSTPAAGGATFVVRGSATPVIIAPHSSLRESVTFRPRRAGSISSGWTFTANDGAAPLRLLLSGTGIARRPGAPRDVAAVVGYGAATVSWRSPTNEGRVAITLYRVRANDSSAAARGGQTCTSRGPTSCIVDGLYHGDTYTFTVTAANAAGVGVSSRSFEVTIPPVATLSIVPGAGPGGPRLTPVGDPLGGAVTYYALNDTAQGCRVSGDILDAATGGSCVVVGVRAARGEVPSIASRPVVIDLPGKIAARRILVAALVFPRGARALTTGDAAIIKAMAQVISDARALTVTSSAGGDPRLAQWRADLVGSLLQRLSSARITKVVVTSTSTNVVTVKATLS